VRVKPTNVANYIDLLLTEKTDFPVYEKELQGVFPGCYTTQVDMKRHNRQSEQLLFNAEKMSELAAFFNYRDYYPVRDISEAWKLALLNQAHDLAAGSGIAPSMPTPRNSTEDFRTRLPCPNSRCKIWGSKSIPVARACRWWLQPAIVRSHRPGYGGNFRRLAAGELVAVHEKETVPVQILKTPRRQGLAKPATVAFVAQNVPQMGLNFTGW